MWEKEGNLLIYKNQLFFIATTTKEFFEYYFYSDIKDLAFPFLSKEKSLILVNFFKKYSFKIEKHKFLLCEQVHKNRVEFIDHLDNSYFNSNFCGKEFFIFKDIDGILTSLKDTAVIIFTADCIPLFVFEQNKGIFGLIHIGRKGLEEGICETLISSLRGKNLDLNSFNFIIGPHICSSCYKIEGLPYSISDRVKKILTSFGVDDSKISISSYCTFHTEDPQFFSYRKDKTNMRNLSIIFSK